MPSRALVVLLPLAALALASALPATAAAPGDTDTDEAFVVRLDDAPDADSVADLREHARETQEPVVDLIRGNGGEVVRRLWITNAVLARGERARSAVAELEGVRVHENHIYRLAQTGTETRTGGSPVPVRRGVRRVNATGVWTEFGVRGGGASVFVLDTGVNVSHPDVDLHTTDPGNETYPGGWAEFDATGARVNSTPHDAGRHGTHASGVVAGGNASGRWMGVAPNATLAHAKVFDETGTFAQISAGMQWAVANDADVLSLGFGVGCSDAPDAGSMVSSVRNADAAGTLVVAPSGNGGGGCSASPADVFDVLAVGAVDPDGDVPGFSGGDLINTSSRWGEDAPSDWPDEYRVPDVVAPGVGVLGPVPGGYARMDGTSAAVPHAAGVAALVESATARDMSPEALHGAIANASEVPDGSSSGDRYGSGVVDAYRAVNSSVAGPMDLAENLPPLGPGAGEGMSDTDDEPSETGNTSGGRGLPGFTAAPVLLALALASLAVARKRT